MIRKKQITKKINKDHSLYKNQILKEKIKKKSK